MKTIDTAEQIGLFGAAATAFRAIATAKPADAHALSAAGLVVVALAPTWGELESYRAAAGLPPLDRTEYEAMLGAARSFAARVVTGRETQH